MSEKKSDAWYLDRIAALKAELEETLSTVTLLSGERAALKAENEALKKERDERDETIMGVHPSRYSISLEIKETLERLGHWVPAKWVGPDLITAVGLAFERYESSLAASRKECERIRALWGEAATERDLLVNDKAAILGGMQAKEIAAIQAKLSAYEAWQPSDPGTKEAMEWAARNKDNPLACDHKPMLDALATALTAAMVRLEEAEKA